MSHVNNEHNRRIPTLVDKVGLKATELRLRHLLQQVSHRIDLAQPLWMLIADDCDDSIWREHTDSLLDGWQCGLGVGCDGLISTWEIPQVEGNCFDTSTVCWVDRRCDRLVACAR